MKKFRGKALAALLSLALIASSLPVTLASASTKTQTGVLSDDPDNDTFYLVNGGTDEDARSVTDFQNLVYASVPLETKDHEEVTDVQVSSISHVSGDRVVKWDIDDDNGDVKLSLRNSDSEGDEVIAILYKGDYTDDDDNDYTVRASTKVTIHALDLNSTVVGNAAVTAEGYADVDDGTDSPELDDDFALKTTSGNPDTQKLSVFKAVPVNSDSDCLAKWQRVYAVADTDTSVPSDAIYTMKSSNKSRVSLADELDSASTAGLVKVSGATEDDPTAATTSATSVTFTAPSAASDATLTYSIDYAGATTDVTDESATSGEEETVSDLDNGAVVTVKALKDGKTTTSKYVYYEAAKVPTGSLIATVVGPSTANVTFTAEPTDNATDSIVADEDKDIKAKVKVAKEIKADDAGNYTTIGDNDKTYITDGNTKIYIDGGYEVNFGAGYAGKTIDISGSAKLDKVSGTVAELNIGDAKVSTVDLDCGAVKVTDEDAKVGDISTDADNDYQSVTPNVDLTADTHVGDIDVDGDGKVTISSGSTGKITTDGSVDLSCSEDDYTVSVGAIEAKDVTIDSQDGKVSVTSIKSTDASSTIELQGDDVTVGSIDFDYRPVEMTFDDFQGEIPAPSNATKDGASISTTNEDDDVTVTGDADVDSISLEDDSKMVFEGKLSVDSLDGSGKMFIGANDLYIGDDASGVMIKLTASDLKAGDTVFTAASDAVDEEDLDFFGFTVKKDEGKTTDTFKVDQLKFAGLAMSKTSDKIVLGDSTTYTASAYAPGTALPEGYSIEFDIDDNSGVFELTDNGNGTAAVKVVDYDETFSDENKATLKAYLVDEDGDEDDDYEAAECNLTALKVPEVTFTSDTNNNFTLAPGASYQFKITATTAPVMTAGSAGVISSITNVGKSGNDYFIKITAAANANGKATGIYVNGTKLLVVTVSGSQTFKSDTTSALTVKKGASYQYGITTNNGAAPTFTLGSSNVFHYELAGHNGSTYFFKITAVGAVGAQTGVYVNGTKVNVAKVG